MTAAAAGALDAVGERQAGITWRTTSARPASTSGLALGPAAQCASISGRPQYTSHTAPPPGGVRRLLVRAQRGAPLVTHPIA